jgi:ATP-dependent exoDNAse (exonuclease V) alpha subunit
MCSAGRVFSSVPIYHCKVKVINRKAGPGAVGSAAYRAGERIRDEKSGQVFNYQRRKGIVHTEIISPRTAPDWVSDRATLWNTVELTEKRKDAQLAREIMVALPKELDQGQQIRLVRGYLNQHFIKKGMVADFAIHAPSKGGDDRNHHAHILLTMRKITSEGFSGKVREWNAKSNIYQWRQAWENYTNQALEQAGLDCRVDCRSHAAKGLDREPQRHLGYQATTMERRGEPSDLGNENRAIMARNAMREQLRSEQLSISDERGDFDREPATLAINVIQQSETNSHESNDGKISDTIEPDGPLLNPVLSQPENPELSVCQRKEVLEKYAKTFEERKIELSHQIEKAPDKKTQDRLRLQDKLESAYFEESFNTLRASVLAEEDLQKNVNEIAASQHRARKAGRDNQAYTAEWNSRAVREEGYFPIDQKSADKIKAMKEAEQKAWSDFAIKAEKNGWSPARIEKERQFVQDRLDYALELKFSRELNLDYSLGLGM